MLKVVIVCCVSVYRCLSASTVYTCIDYVIWHTRIYTKLSSKPIFDAIILLLSYILKFNDSPFLLASSCMYVCMLSGRGVGVVAFFSPAALFIVIDFVVVVFLVLYNIQSRAIVCVCVKNSLSKSHSRIARSIDNDHIWIENAMTWDCEIVNGMPYTCHWVYSEYYNIICY